jgi:predicted RecB family nuclease
LLVRAQRLQSHEEKQEIIKNIEKELEEKGKKFFDETFPEWEAVDAEHQLYEAVENHPHAFKGFIDAIIKTKGKKGETLYWILDHKTTQKTFYTVY